MFQFVLLEPTIRVRHRLFRRRHHSTIAHTATTPKATIRLANRIIIVKLLVLFSDSTLFNSHIIMGGGKRATFIDFRHSRFCRLPPSQILESCTAHNSSSYSKGSAKICVTPCLVLFQQRHHFPRFFSRSRRSGVTHRAEST